MSTDIRYRESRKVTVIGMIINTSLAIMKMIIGVIGRSPALFTDGIHSFSDLISDFFVLFAAKYGNKGEDSDHPYGHQRIETIATAALSLLLIIVGFSIAYDAVKNLMTGEIISPSNYTIVAAVISVIANEWLFRYTLKTANKIDSDLLRANAWHSRSDALSSIVVLVGLVASMFGYPFMDALAAIVVCIMIIKMGITWGYQAISELVDTGASIETIKKIEKYITEIDGVLSFHNLRTRKMAGQIFLDVHILVNSKISASEGHYIGERVRSILASHIDNIKDITVHVDVDEHSEKLPKLKNLPPSQKELLAELNPIWSKIIPQNAIEGIKFYYIQDKVEIHLFLDKSEIEIPKVTMDKMIQESKSVNTKISKIKIYYLSS